MLITTKEDIIAPNKISAIFLQNTPPRPSFWINAQTHMTPSHRINRATDIEYLRSEDWTVIFQGMYHASSPD
jgi:hypothetical protein